MEARSQYQRDSNCSGLDKKVKSKGSKLETFALCGEQRVSENQVDPELHQLVELFSQPAHEDFINNYGIAYVHQRERFSSRSGVLDYMRVFYHVCKTYEDSTGKDEKAKRRQEETNSDHIIKSTITEPRSVQRMMRLFNSISQDQVVTRQVSWKIIDLGLAFLGFAPLLPRIAGVLKPLQLNATKLQKMGLAYSSYSVIVRIAPAEGFDHLAYLPSLRIDSTLAFARKLEIPILEKIDDHPCPAWKVDYRLDQVLH
jgi:hypothetical protein